MSIAQPCVGLSEEGVEEAIDDRQGIRGLVGMDLAREAAPYATTLLKFHCLREAYPLTERLFTTIFCRHQRAPGRQGVDVEGRYGEQGDDHCRIPFDEASKPKARPREASSQEGKPVARWQVGMLAPIGVDAESGLVPTMVTTAANVSDVTQASQWLHGEEKDVFGDTGDQGVEKREENVMRTRILGSLGISPCGPSEAQGVAGRCTQAHRRQDREVQSDSAGEGPASIPRCQEPVRA